MPRIKSAIKRVEVAERNRQRNKSWRSAIRTARNTVEDALERKNPEACAAALSGTFSVIDRAVTKGVLHKNTAARRKARLIHAIRKAQA